MSDNNIAAECPPPAPAGDPLGNTPAGASDSSAVALTDAERAVILSTLGRTSDGTLIPFTNIYWATLNKPFPLFEGLIARGLAWERVDAEARFRQFHVTAAGIRALGHKPERFPHTKVEAGE